MPTIRKALVSDRADKGSERRKGYPPEQERTKEQLLDQLADFLFQPEDEEVDSEALAALLDRLDKEAPLPDELDLDAEKSLARFHKQNAPVLEAVAAQCGEGPSRPAGRRAVRFSFARIAAAAAVLILLLCTTAQAAGLDVFSAIARWTAETFCLDGQSASYAAVQNNPLGEGGTGCFDTLEAAVEAFGIDAPIIPKEIPERFELASVTAVNQRTGVSIFAEYTSEDGYLHIRYREVPLQNFYTLEKEYGEAAPYYIKRIKHYLTSDHGDWAALWLNGDFECQMFGTISEQELKSMIDSIY